MHVLHERPLLLHKLKRRMLETLHLKPSAPYFYPTPIKDFDISYRGLIRDDRF